MGVTTRYSILFNVWTGYTNGKTCRNVRKIDGWNAKIRPDPANLCIFILDLIIHAG